MWVDLDQIWEDLPQMYIKIKNHINKYGMLDFKAKFYPNYWNESFPIRNGWILEMAVVLYKCSLNTTD